MKITTLDLENTNCYLISTEKSAIVIDPGYKSGEVEKFLTENADKERLILITHAHFDHIGDAKRLREITGVKIAIGELDNPALSDNVVNEGANFGIDIEPFDANILLNDGEVFSVGDLEIKVYLTQGHTVGGVCYYINGNLFTGDILFYRGFGNTCFHGGSRRKIVESLNFLFNTFPLDTPVYSGHGIATTIGSEKSYYGR
ncbi:MAG: MBL fold metallo-hydrolase [Clostridia bacterium]|nr:MBL fold metallo-hydrolase [Clostridia bacterium]